MAKKRTQVKVIISGMKIQKKILSAVAKIEGVEKLDIDPNKGILIVVGDVEPMPIFKALEKIGVKPEIITVGPPKPAGHGPNCNCNLCRPNSDNQQRQTWQPGQIWQPGQTWQPGTMASCQYCCSTSRCNRCELISVGYPSDAGQCTIL